MRAHWAMRGADTTAAATANKIMEETDFKM